MGRVSLVLVAFLALVQFRLWAGGDGVAEMWRLRQAVDAQHAENAVLAARNQRLAAEVIDLKEGVEAIEERARRDLGMTGVDETFYHFVTR